ncbi:MFS transporter [uncultured Desulfobulbus sp.]|uniref:MFS transporter n=1 Tax=uncultured Desulfobulbus sp. TaxID=239745 RepID=UPI0029C7C965|nr:MFS transporter [uncultured Desulfobulbus sp.]
MQHSHRPTLWALMAGNFVIGTGVLAPAGLISDLSQAFDVDAATVGTLIAYGGALLCIEAPLLAFLSNRMNRRRLLVGALLLYAIGHFCSSLVADFHALLVIRLIMITAVAVFTPQAASALPLFIPPERRAHAITFIFLGWSLAAAIGIPLVNLTGSLVGWQAAYRLLAAACTLAAVAVFTTLPSGLKAHRLSMAAWGKVLTSNRIWCILAISSLAIAGQYIKYPYIVVDLKSRLATGPLTTAALLLVYGCASILGTMSATWAVGRLGVRTTVSTFLGVILLGLILWTSQPVSLPLTGLTLFIWGIGMSPAIAAQQARLIEADPVAASASTSMNTSVVYLGQAAGTILGGHLLTSGHTALSGGVAISLLAMALLTSVLLHRHLRI